MPAPALPQFTNDLVEVPSLDAAIVDIGAAERRGDRLQEPQEGFDEQWCVRCRFAHRRSKVLNGEALVEAGIVLDVRSGSKPRFEMLEDRFALTLAADAIDEIEESRLNIAFNWARAIKSPAVVERQYWRTLSCN